MRKWLVFENNGEFDVRLIAMVGATSKTGESGKIGMFGSGSDYALALAMRLGLGVVAYSGTKSFRFKTVEEVTDRGTFKRIAYSAREDGKPAKLHKLSLTDQFGAQHWTKPWFIFREFYSNALDEGGASVTLVAGYPTGVPGKTRFCVEANPELIKVYQNLGDYFRPADESLTGEGRVVRKSEGKSRIYRRGVFVMELDSPAAYFDYDLYHLSLNESRVADSWDVRYGIREVWYNASVDQAAQFLGLIESGALDGKMEADIEYGYGNPSADWSEAFYRAHGADAVLCPNSRFAVEAAVEAQRTPVVIPNQRFRDMLQKAGVAVVEKVVGQHAMEGLRFLKDEEWTERERKLVDVAKAICRTAFGKEIDKFPHRLYTEQENKTMGQFFPTLGVVGLNRSVLAGGIRKVAETLAEEYTHGISGAGDKTRDFQNFACTRMVDLAIQLRGEIY